MHVLFLDESGGARGPLAEALLRHVAPWHDATAACWSPSHVRPEVREVLAENGVSPEGLRARGLGSVALEEVDLVVDFVPDEGRLRLHPDTPRRSWRLPDPLSAPPAERMEAFRAARDEIERRLRTLVKELE